MQLLAFIVSIVAFASASSAAALPAAAREVSARDTTMTISFTPQSKCGNTTWKNKTSPAGALAADCKYLESSIKEGGAVYSGTGPHQVVAYNSCQVAVLTPGQWAIGNQGISDILRDAVARFARLGRVAAEGDMPCPSGGLRWSISNPN